MKRTAQILALIGALIAGCGCGAVVSAAVDAAAAEQARRAAVETARNACYQSCADAGGSETVVNTCRAGCDQRFPNP